MIVVRVRAMVGVSVRIELTNYVTSRLDSLGLRLHKAILRKSWSHLDNFMPCFGLKQLCLVLMLALNFMSCLGVCLNYMPWIALKAPNFPSDEMLQTT